MKIRMLLCLCLCLTAFAIQGCSKRTINAGSGNADGPFVPPGQGNDGQVDGTVYTVMLHLDVADASGATLKSPKTTTTWIDTFGAVYDYATSFFAPKAVVVPVGDTPYGHGSLFNPGSYDYLTAGTDLSGFVTGTSIDVPVTVAVGRWYDFTFRIGTRWADVRLVEVNGVSPTTACMTPAVVTPPYTRDYSRVPLVAFRIIRDITGVESVQFSQRAGTCDFAVRDLTIRVNGNSANNAYDELDWATVPQVRYSSSLEWDGVQNPTSIYPVLGADVVVTYGGVPEGIPFWIDVQRPNPNPFADEDPLCSGIVPDVWTWGVHAEPLGGVAEEMVEVLDTDVNASTLSSPPNCGESANVYYVYVADDGMGAGGNGIGDNTDNRGAAATLR